MIEKRKRKLANYYLIHKWKGSFDYLTIGGSADWVEKQIRQFEAQGYYLIGFSVSDPRRVDMLHALLIGFDAEL